MCFRVHWRCIDFDDCQGYLGMATRSETYVIASIAKTQSIYGETLAILNLKFYMLLFSLALVLMLVEAIGGPRGASGHSPGAPGAHLAMFDKYIKKCKTWITSF